ncbi:hypothetical protein SDC9_119605 [bioreactor metagenome]|uniref:Helix-hairpin-helix DNA-binding motif class 1 domain-containing protein n=1 Tax=bioreactor metagenome TaxID=1076179 RepID=A0A645C4S3_9ZZZZ
MGKLTKSELALLLLTALTLAFFAGWFLGAGRSGADYSVSLQREGALPVAAASANPAPGMLEGERINLNTASQQDLQRLPGIGEKRAGDIIAYREENGPFRSVEEITNVSGIGEGTLRGILDYAAVDEE